MLAPPYRTHGASLPPSRSHAPCPLRPSGACSRASPPPAASPPRASPASSPRARGPASRALATPPKSRRRVSEPQPGEAGPTSQSPSPPTARTRSRAPRRQASAVRPHRCLGAPRTGSPSARVSSRCTPRIPRWAAGAWGRDPTARTGAPASVGLSMGDPQASWDHVVTAAGQEVTALMARTRAQRARTGAFAAHQAGSML